MRELASFFIYDYESFGIDPARDRPAQFAGLRTDMDFNPIGDPIMFYCKQTKDYLPSPEAVLVTGITPQICNIQGLPEYQFADKILREFSQPNTCILGYNNIRYDDEMTRYTLYRNLCDPYGYSWKNGNSRWDLLDLVRACYALRPDGINWVYDDNGIPSFKLELLTQANGIEHSNAHDAMADVYATIAMAKLIKQQQPKLFNFYFQNRHKKSVENLINVSAMTPLVHVSGMFGNARANISIIAPVAWDSQNPNKVLTVDLLSDGIGEMLNRSVEENQQILFTSKAELKEQGILPVPIKGVHINKCPFIAPLATLRPQDAERLNINLEQALANLELLSNHIGVRELVVNTSNFEGNFPASDNVETELYAGFFSSQDLNQLAQLREMPVEQWESARFSFSDFRIPQLLFHYRARYFFKTLSRSEQIRWQKYCQNKFVLQVEDLNQRLEHLYTQHAQDPAKIALLQEVEKYMLSLCG